MSWLPLHELKLALAITDPRSKHRDDLALESFARIACDWVERETDRGILPTPYRRRFDGNGRARLPIPLQPILEVIELEVDGQAVTIGNADEWARREVDAYFDPSGWIVRPTCWPLGLANIAITWTAGWDPIPEEIRRLAAAVAAMFWRERDRWGDDGKALAGQVEKFTRELPPFEARTFATLRNWRNLYIDDGIELDPCLGRLGCWNLGQDELGGY